MAESSAITREGILDPDGVTVHLNGKLPLPPGRITLTVHVPAQRSGEEVLEVLERIHREQRESGRKLMTEEEMAAEIAAMRAEDDEYERRMEEIWSQTRTGSQERR
jgi:hypothetical protein